MYRVKPEQARTEKGKELFDGVISQVPTLDTDALVFYAICGLSDSAFSAATMTDIDYFLRSELYGRFGEYNDMKRSQTPVEEWRLQKRFAINTSVYHPMDFRTLRELKAKVEERGLIFKNVGVQSLAAFNKALTRYELEPIKVGGYQFFGLRKYGLVSARQEGVVTDHGTILSQDGEEYRLTPRKVKPYEAGTAVSFMPSSEVELVRKITAKK